MGSASHTVKASRFYLQSLRNMLPPMKSKSMKAGAKAMSKGAMTKELATKHELKQDEIGLNDFEGKAEAEEYDDYYEYEMEGVEDEEDWVEYEYVDLHKDSDGDGL